MASKKAPKTRLDSKCWKGYKKSGTKISYGSGTPTRTNKCVKKKK